MELNLLSLEGGLTNHSGSECLRIGVCVILIVFYYFCLCVGLCLCFPGLEEGRGAGYGL